MCVLVLRLWWHFRELVSLTITRSKGKIRGLESLGMICSLGELGISDSVVPKEFADGIQILPENALPGDEVFSYLDLDDEIIELSITPNRADALSMRGVAHEVAAIYDKAVNFKEFTLSETDQVAADALSVGIETDKGSLLCGSYLGQCDHRTKSTMVAKPPS